MLVSFQSSSLTIHAKGIPRNPCKCTLFYSVTALGVYFSESKAILLQLSKLQLLTLFQPLCFMYIPRVEKSTLIQSAYMCSLQPSLSNPYNTMHNKELPDGSMSALRKVTGSEVGTNSFSASVQVFQQLLILRKVSVNVQSQIHRSCIHLGFSMCTQLPLTSEIKS